MNSRKVGPTIRLNARKWKNSQQGNLWMEAAGHHAVVFQRDNGYSYGINQVYASTGFPTQGEAQAAALDALRTRIETDAPLSDAEQMERRSINPRPSVFTPPPTSAKRAQLIESHLRGRFRFRTRRIPPLTEAIVALNRLMAGEQGAAPHLVAIVNRECHRVAGQCVALAYLVGASGDDLRAAYEQVDPADVSLALKNNPFQLKSLRKRAGVSVDQPA